MLEELIKVTITDLRGHKIVHMCHLVPWIQNPGHPLTIGNHFENCAAIFVGGQIRDVPIANNVLKGIL